MGTKNNPGKFDCYAALDPDEPHFVLKATDPLAPYMVRLWAAFRRWDFLTALNIFIEAARCTSEMKDGEKEAEAEHCADAMRDWYERKRA